MRVLVTGSSGHLGEALVRPLQGTSHEVVSLDLMPSPFTTHVGSIADRSCVERCMRGVGAVLHTATLHKPHVATHARQDFVDTNIMGTLHLLEEAVAAGVTAFVFTSTTSAFGEALTPPAGAPALWVTEDVRPVARNIYGVTKTAAEDLCELFHRDHGTTSSRPRSPPSRPSAARRRRSCSGSAPRPAPRHAHRGDRSRTSSWRRGAHDLAASSARPGLGRRARAGRTRRWPLSPGPPAGRSHGRIPGPRRHLAHAVADPGRNR